ncbi:unnamed protein product [Paramecium octaurelia]|nr:unnamed protein product [Paramecium octaurelia]
MDVAAKLGGLFTIIRALLDIILYPIQSILYKLFLINFLINHQNKGNNKDIQLQKSKKQDILLHQLITSSKKREFYNQQTELINKYLDVRQILIHPMQFTQKIEGLQDSIKKIDILSSRQIKLISKQEMDELVVQSNNEEYPDCRCLSYGTINSESKIKNQDNYVIPKMKIQIH